MRTAIALLLFLVAGQTYAERGVADIAYAISLLGTDMEGEDGDAVLIITREEILQGPYPESVIAAVTHPLRFTQAGTGFPEESNLAVLAKISFEAEFGDTEHTLMVDATKMGDTEKELFISPEKLLKLVMKAVQKTVNLNNNGDTKPIKVAYKLPEGMKVGSLPDVIKPKGKKDN